MGVATGCGCKEVYRFPHSTYPYSSFFFTAASLLFVHFFNVFRSLQSMNELWTIIHNKMKWVKYVTAHAQKFSDITICILVYTVVHVP